jgi:hypothetical protein
LAVDTIDVDLQDGHDSGNPATAFGLELVWSSLRSRFATITHEQALRGLGTGMAAGLRKAGKKHPLYVAG